MIIMYSFLILVSAFFAATVAGLPQQTTSFDPSDPNKSDPTSVQEQAFTFDEGPDPCPNGFPTLPAECDSFNLTEECFKVLATKGEGAKLQWDPNHGIDTTRYLIITDHLLTSY